MEFVLQQRRSGKIHAFVSSIAIQIKTGLMKEPVRIGIPCNDKENGERMKDRLEKMFQKQGVKVELVIMLPRKQLSGIQFDAMEIT